MALLPLLLLMLAAPANEYPPSHPVTIDRYELLCSTFLDCGEIAKPPLVIFTNTGFALGYYYYDTDAVFITEECLGRMSDRAKCKSVVLHEMTHYVLYKKYELTGCASEAAAWGVSNAYVLSVGRPDLYMEDWRVNYKECRSYGDANNSKKVQAP